MTNELESRLRHAFEARTADVPVPPEPDWLAPDAARSRRAYPALAMVAAVAATLMVLFTVHLVVGGGDRGDDGPAGPGPVDVTPVRAATSPGFVLRTDETPALQIVSVTTGKTLGTLRPPAGYGDLWAGHAAAAADDRTFFFSVRKGPNGRPMVARVHLDEQGRPDGRAVLVAAAPAAGELDSVAPPLPAPNTNEPDRWAALDGLSVSPDATRLAMMVSTGKSEGLSVWDLATGRATTWGSPVPLASLAWSADGMLLWSGDRSAGRLDPQSAPGTLRATRTYPELGEPAPAQLLPNGDRLAIRTAANSARLVQLPSLPGRPERVLDQWTSTAGDHGGMAGVAVDGSGRHVLYHRDGETARMDLTTRKRTSTGLDHPDSKLAEFTW